MKKLHTSIPVLVTLLVALLVTAGCGEQPEPLGEPGSTSSQQEEASNPTATELPPTATPEPVTGPTLEEIEGAITSALNSFAAAHGLENLDVAAAFAEFAGAYATAEHTNAEWRDSVDDRLDALEDGGDTPDEVADQLADVRDQLPPEFWEWLASSGLAVQAPEYVDSYPLEGYGWRDVFRGRDWSGICMNPGMAWPSGPGFHLGGGWYMFKGGQIIGPPPTGTPPCWWVCPTCPTCPTPPPCWWCPTPTPTKEGAPSATPTSTATATNTATSTSTASATASNTPSPDPSRSPTPTPSATATPSSTPSPTNTPSATASPTNRATSSPQPTATPTVPCTPCPPGSGGPCPTFTPTDLPETETPTPGPATPTATPGWPFECDDEELDINYEAQLESHEYGTALEDEKGAGSVENHFGGKNADVRVENNACEVTVANMYHLVLDRVSGRSAGSDEYGNCIVAYARGPFDPALRNWKGEVHFVGSHGTWAHAETRVAGNMYGTQIGLNEMVAQSRDSLLRLRDDEGRRVCKMPGEFFVWPGAKTIQFVELGIRQTSP